MESSVIQFTASFHSKDSLTWNFIVYIFYSVSLKVLAVIANHVGFDLRWPFVASDRNMYYLLISISLGYWGLITENKIM